ncbi:hypothetical protein SLITO_v1c01470 [Spiroplasma litorale]|uniref:Uncharacterized protein n=1 Tax=Spiroplasma litorale TaxID=216942 RepID=A0A0K1W0X6_9MOLU|nr:hypothetical protein [Spiroplasma litorale]AKX33813.1 hypothetical protein SLITO_v1c01470 [Spiroplasma litorale]
MAIFKKKQSKLDKSEYAKLEEERVPNHWTFNDDPILNMEPVFADKDQSKKSKLEDLPKDDAQIKIDKLSELKANLRKNNPKKVEGPLGSIINSALKKSQDIQNQVMENDPVIAKLQKIEELRRTGAIDESVYTDIKKIKEQTVSYSDRAKKYHEKNATVVLESELDRVKRLSEISKNRIDGKNVNDYINRNKFSFKTPISKTVNKFSSLENEVKDKLEQLKIKKERILEDELNQTIEDIRTMEFDSDVTREEFLKDKINEFNSLLRKKEKSLLIKPRRKSKKNDK